MDLYKLLAVGSGGLIGSVTRYATVRFVDSSFNSLMPYGTLTVNVVGSFLLGMIYAISLRHTNLGETWRLFMGAGFCGGFTTFSAFALENFTLLDEKLYGTSLLYIGLSLIAGLSALAAGVWIGRFI